MPTLRDLAINTALMGDWKKAIHLNEELLKEDPYDTEALNRLAFAFNILGKTKDAKSSYQKVLEIDNLNQIALRGLKRLLTTPQANGGHTNGVTTMSNVFIEETGKTKVVELVHVCDSKTLLSLRIGESLSLSIKRLKIFVLDSQKRYIGAIPDNIAKRLIKLMDGGNEYEAFVKSGDNVHRIVIFIRETKRSARLKNQPSFITEKTKFVLQKNTPDKKVKAMKEEEEDEAYEEPEESL
jgi:tetratricopeptide (TPR) repeat protein